MHFPVLASVVEHILVDAAVSDALQWISFLVGALQEISLLLFRGLKLDLVAINGLLLAANLFAIALLVVRIE